MKAVILAGGLGTRISEETAVRPKPMVEIGGMPVLWHILKIYSRHGVNDFIICLGYKGYMIKEYFANYHLHDSSVTFDLAAATTTIHASSSDQWKITLVETGEDTQTGGRIKRIEPFLDGDTFAMTYGDAVTDLDIGRLVEFHRAESRLATVTAVRPRARFGAMELEGDVVSRFEEKPIAGDAWINGGFFVLSRRVLEYIEGDETIWEHEPIERLTKERELRAYAHYGFWQPMDTLRDRNLLEDMWSDGAAPWRIWG